MTVGIGGFDGAWLIRFKFAEVQFLDEVGWVEDVLLAHNRHVFVTSIEVRT